MMYTHDVIEAILKEAAEKCILPYFKKLTVDQIDTKAHAEDFVTIADRQAEIYLTAALQKLLPGSLVLGEEGYSEDPSLMERCAIVDDVWIVDPVDGTLNFKNGNDAFCTILSHVKSGKIVGAWIYAPILNKFLAWSEGGKAFINSKEVQFDTSYKNIGQMMAINCISWHKGENIKELMQKNFSHFGRARRCLSFGTDTILMLENDVDVLSFGKGNPWDIGPCAAIVQALGGKAVKTNGKNVSEDELFTTKGMFFATRCPEQWDAAKTVVMQGLEDDDD